MARVTVADLKASRIPAVLNFSSTDTRFLQYVNEAQERLLKKHKCWGATAKYSFYTSSGTITLPRQVASIEKVAVSHVPTPVHDFWFEFLDNGWGTRQDELYTQECNLVGRYPVFNDIIPSDKKLRVMCDLATDVGKEVLLLGFDDDGNWIRTTQDGVLADGEVVVLAQTPGTLSTLNFATITDIQAPDDLDGQWWLYEYDTVNVVDRLIGQYQYDETRPSYARYYLPFLTSVNEATLVEALVKLEHVPVKNDTDYLIIGNIPALKKGCMAVRAEEEGRVEESRLYWLEAGELLDQELLHYLGEGRTPGIQIRGSSVGAVEQIYTPL